MKTNLSRNQFWVDARYVMAGASFYLSDMARLMVNIEYDHDIRSFVVRATGLGVTLFLDVYLKPELFADRPEFEPI